MNKAILYFKESYKQQESQLDKSSMSAMSMLSVTSAMPDKTEKLKAALDNYKRRLKVQRSAYSVLEGKYEELAGIIER